MIYHGTLMEQCVLALFQHRPALDIDIEHVNLLVPMGNFTTLIDPKDGIFHLVRI